MGCIKQLALVWCCYLGLFCYCGCCLIFFFWLFGLFIFEFSELDLLASGIHNLFKSVHHFFLKCITPIKKYIYIFFDFKKSGVQLVRGDATDYSHN